MRGLRRSRWRAAEGPWAGQASASAPLVVSSTSGGTPYSSTRIFRATLSKVSEFVARPLVVSGTNRIATRRRFVASRRSLSLRLMPVCRSRLRRCRRAYDRILRGSVRFDVSGSGAATPVRRGRTRSSGGALPGHGRVVLPCSWCGPAMEVSRGGGRLGLTEHLRCGFGCDIDQRLAMIGVACLRGDTGQCGWWVLQVPCCKGIPRSAPRSASVSDVRLVY